MLRRTGLVILILGVQTVLLQAQPSNELARRNGFKSIKLGSPIDSVKGAFYKKEFLEKEEFPARLYETEFPEYKTIGEVEVQKVQLMTYKNLLYKIVVTVDKDPRVMQALEKSYGKAVYVVRTTCYSWKAEMISLTFLAHKNDIELTYRCYPVYKMMLADKGKKVDAIAEDF
jgi:hypothetical protein